MRPDLNSTLTSSAAASRWPRGGLLALGLALIVLTALLTAPAAHAADRIYWSNYDGDSIAYANLNGNGGGTVNTTGATVAGPMGLTIDPSRGLIYWVNWTGNTGTTISYAHLDGSGGGDLAITGATIDGPHGLAIDPSIGDYGRLYWPNFADESISYADLDGAGGGSGGDLVLTDATVDGPRGVMIDPLTNRLYWSNFSDGDGTTISWASLDGTDDGDLLQVGTTGEGPEGTAIDPATRKIYWSDYGNWTLLQYADVDLGTGVSPFEPEGATRNGVHGVAIDPGARRLYWANYGSNGISYASLDGDGGGDLDVSGTGHAVSGPVLPAILKAPSGTTAPQVSGGTDPGATLSCSPGAWAGDVLESLLYRAPESLAYQWSRDGNDLPGAETNSITANPEGSYRCRVTATNAAGATSQTSSAHAIDTTPPETTINSGPSGTTADNDPSFAFGSEAGASFKCRLDGPGAATGSFASCTSPKHYTDLADGDYTFQVQASDPVHNVDPTPASRSFTIDTTPPETTINSGPSGTTADDDPSFAFSSEAGASFKCRLDGPGAVTATFTLCSSPKAYADLADGDYTFQVRASDPVDNADPTPASRSFTVDTTAPVTTINSGPSGTTADNDPSFAFSSEAGASFECRLGGPGAATGTFASCTSPKSYAELADGGYTFQVRASDPVHNVDPTPASRSFTVDTTSPPDTTPPKTTITKQPKRKIKTRKKSVRVTVSFSSEPGATFDCELDKADFEPCSSPYRVKVRSKRKRHNGSGAKQDRISVEAIDGAGNVGRPAVVKFKVIRKR